jgi:SPP1 family predicted phage head-tail adaptor
MRAGKLRHRVTIQQRSTDRDPEGQPIVAWTDYAVLWADVRFLNGRQFVASSAEANSATASIRIRFRADIAAPMRVVWGSFTFDILAVLPDAEALEHVDLACSVGASNG